MPKTSLKRTRTFIEMYNMEDVLTVQELDECYQVSHQTGDDDYDIYVCKTLYGAAECVNDIIFGLPINCEEITHDVENEMKNT